MTKKRKLTTVDSNDKWKKSKEEIAQRQAEEAKLNEFEKLNSEPPEGLDTIAKNEWDRVIPLLQELPIAKLDLAMVENYCVLYSQMRHFNKVFKDYRKKASEDPDADNRTNKAFGNYVKASSELRNVCNNLGMTIDSRLKIVVPNEKEMEDPIMSVLNS